MKKTKGERAADAGYLKPSGRITPQSHQLLSTSILRNRLAQHVKNGHTGNTTSH